MIPTHKMIITRTYRSTKDSKTYYFTKKPNQYEQNHAIDSFGIVFKRYRSDELSIEIKECRLTPLNSKSTIV